MKQLCVLAALAALAATFCSAQDATPQAANTNQTSAPTASTNADNNIKGSFPVRLEKSIDSKKLKEGDTVVCRTITPIHSRSGFMIPTGSKVIGHVTQASARSKGDPDSALAIAFDKIELGKGEEIPMKGTLQAVAPSLGGPFLDTSAQQSSMGSNTSGRGSSNGSAPPATSSVQVAGPNSGTPILRPDSQGVLGMKHLQMSSDGVLNAEGKEVKLEGGTQIMVHAEIQMASR